MIEWVAGEPPREDNTRFLVWVDPWKDWGPPFATIVEWLQPLYNGGPRQWATDDSEDRDVPGIIIYWSRVNPPL